MTQKTFLNSPKKRSLQVGFTLIELVVVVGILLLLAALYMPRLASNTQGIMDTQKVVHLLASDLRYTRRLAMTNSANYTLQISTSPLPVTYQILRASDSVQTDVTREIPNTVSVSGDTAITFVSTGGASADRTITLTGPRNTYTIYVFSRTGAAQIRRIS